MRRVTFLAALLVAVACGERKTDVRTRSGSIAFTGTAAYFLSGTGTFYAPDGGLTATSLLQIEVHESAEGCQPWQGVTPPTRSILTVGVAVSAGDSIGPGHYTVALPPSLGHASGTYFHQDTVGSLLLNTVSGELDLANSGGTADGSIDVTLQGGTRMEGVFAAVPCE